jgi:hypothetical protein
MMLLADEALLAANTITEQSGSKWVTRVTCHAATWRSGNPVTRITRYTRPSRRNDGWPGRGLQTIQHRGCLPVGIKRALRRRPGSKT